MRLSKTDTSVGKVALGEEFGKHRCHAGKAPNEATEEEVEANEGQGGGCEEGQGVREMREGLANRREGAGHFPLALGSHPKS